MDVDFKFKWSTLNQSIIIIDNQPIDFPKSVNIITKTGNDNFLFAGGRFDNILQDGNPHIWKVSSTGNVIYERTIHGNQIDQITSIFETNDSGVMVNLYSNSGIGGDKTDYCRGGYDNWLIKFAPENLSTTTSNFSNFKIYPNPTTKTISIDFGQNLVSANLVVSNVLGQIVSSKTVNNLDKTSLDINETSGVYFLEITNDKLEKQVFKIVKE